MLTYQCSCDWRKLVDSLGTSHGWDITYRTSSAFGVTSFHHHHYYHHPDTAWQQLPTTSSLLPNPHPREFGHVNTGSVVEQ